MSKSKDDFHVEPAVDPKIPPPAPPFAAPPLSSPRALDDEILGIMEGLIAVTPAAHHLGARIARLRERLKTG